MNEGVLTLPLARFRDYLELSKFRLVSLTLWSAAAGYILAPKGHFVFSILGMTLLGSGLVAAGSMALNEWMERQEDGLMSRTLNRPVPTGRISPGEALSFGLFFSGLGIFTLGWGVNPLCGILAAATHISYVWIYTPLKKKTPFCTLVGAVPGAIPPLIGWAAVTGTLPVSAWVLFAIVFFWQMPHFFALSWFYRSDYEAAGFKMLSVEDPGGKRVARQIFLYTAALLPVSLLPSWMGIAGSFYFWTALALSLSLLFLGYQCLRNLDRWARSFFRASLIYLTLLFILMVLDKA